MIQCQGSVYTEHRGPFYTKLNYILGHEEMGGNLEQYINIVKKKKPNNINFFSPKTYRIFYLKVYPGHWFIFIILKK